MAGYNQYQLCESITPHKSTFWGGFTEISLRASVAVTLAQASESASVIGSDFHEVVVPIISERIISGGRSAMIMFENNDSINSIDKIKFTDILRTNPQDIRIELGDEAWGYAKIKKKISQLADLPRSSAQFAFDSLFNHFYTSGTQDDLKIFDIGTMFIAKATSVVVFEDSSSYRPREKKWVRELATIACTEFVLLCHLARD